MRVMAAAVSIIAAAALTAVGVSLPPPPPLGRLQGQPQRHRPVQLSSRPMVQQTQDPDLGISRQIGHLGIIAGTVGIIGRAAAHPCQCVVMRGLPATAAVAEGSAGQFMTGTELIQDAHDFGRRKIEHVRGGIL